MTGEDWEAIGRDISYNTYLEGLDFDNGALDDEKIISSLFRGLSRSSSIVKLYLRHNEFSGAGLRSMVPFFQQLQSEGFSMIIRALQNSPIEYLFCEYCGIESIEIDVNYAPRFLRNLLLPHNKINDGGCREVAKLLQMKDSTIETLFLDGNTTVGDEGLGILVDTLRHNTSLQVLNLEINPCCLPKSGQIKLLKLVSDVSCIQSTFQSNHSLKHISFQYDNHVAPLINLALCINSQDYPEVVGREKVIQTQLNSATRAALADLQGVSRSLFSDINPLHMPEVLSLISDHHGHGELFIALKASIAELVSMSNRRECIKQQLAYHAAKSEELQAEVAALDARERDEENYGSETRSKKRCRKWWWGLCGGA